MIAKKYVFIPLYLAMCWAPGANGFRTCEMTDSYAWSASTHYTVGEISFDAVTGRASGTETRYNYSNDSSDGHGDCHVTYELTGTYDVGVEVFTLDATRTNYSASCAPALLGVEFPLSRLYALQMAFSEDGTAMVSSAASGEMLASGSWESGRAVYKTPEECTIF